MGLLIHPYDEAKVDWDGNVKGGDSKINMIWEPLGGYLPSIHTS